MANSPIIFIDADGRELELAGNKVKSEQDIRSLLPASCQNFIKVNNAGKVSFDYEKVSDEMKSYEGVKLLNNLVQSKKTYKYAVGDEVQVPNREGYKPGTSNGERGKAGMLQIKPVGDPAPAQQAMANISETPRSDIENGDFMPEPGVNGSVMMADGEFTRVNQTTGGHFVVPRNQIVFHELAENYYRTEKGMDYGGEDKGAHGASSDKGNKFSKEVNGKPDRRTGVADGFKPTK